MNNTTTTAKIELEEVKNQLYGISQNLVMVQIGIENNGYKEFSDALEPVVFSIDNVYKKTSELMERLQEDENEK